MLLATQSVIEVSILVDQILRNCHGEMGFCLAYTGQTVTVLSTSFPLNGCEESTVKLQAHFKGLGKFMPYSEAALLPIYE